MFQRAATCQYSGGNLNESSKQCVVWLWMQGTEKDLQVQQEDDDRNFAAKRTDPPRWDSSAAATDVYLAKAKTIFNVS